VFEKENISILLILKLKHLTFSCTTCGFYFREVSYYILCIEGKTWVISRISQKQLVSSFDVVAKT